MGGSNGISHNFFDMRYFAHSNEEIPADQLLRHLIIGQDICSPLSQVPRVSCRQSVSGATDSPRTGSNTTTIFPHLGSVLPTEDIVARYLAAEISFPRLFRCQAFGEVCPSKLERKGWQWRFLERLKWWYRNRITADPSTPNPMSNRRLIRRYLQ